jgi:uncharacterized phiE125 gp8 family phage protein
MLSADTTLPQRGALERAILPASEPLTLAETKLFLRLDAADVDALVTRLIAAARQAAEEYLRRSLITQSWSLAFDDSAPMLVDLPMGPVQSITSVVSTAQDGTPTNVAANQYLLGAGKRQLFFASPVIGNIVSITYVAGFGAAASVPEIIKQGMLHHIAAMFEGRAVTVLPETSRALYAAWRVERV